MKMMERSYSLMPMLKVPATMYFLTRGIVPNGVTSPCRPMILMSEPGTRPMLCASRTPMTTESWPYSDKVLRDSVRETICWS